MGNQQMTYSSNPLDGTYGDSRLSYETVNFRGTTEIGGDHSATVVHDILDEIIDSVCHRDDSISDPARLTPDEDQAPFNPYVFPDQKSGAENSASNVGYLGNEDSESVNIRNILENNKYEPFKSSNEDVFVDSLEGHYNYENFTKIQDDMYKNVVLDVEFSRDEVAASVCGKRKDSDCLDQKYFRGKEDLTVDGEKLESIGYHFEEVPIKAADDDPPPEINDENHNEDANFANNKNNSAVNKLPLEVNFRSFLPENPQTSEAIQKQLHFSTDFNSNIESHVRNVCNVEEVNEIRSDDDEKKDLSPSSNDESHELWPKDLVDQQFSDVEVAEKSSNLEILKRNEEENLHLTSSAGQQQNSSTVEEFANIVKEICSTVEENKPITDEFYTKICDSPDKIKENCDKIEEGAPVLGDVGSILQGSAVSNEKMHFDTPLRSDTLGSKEDNTTIEQIKTILKDICSSVEVTSSNFKQSSSSSEESSTSKEKCANDFNKLPAQEKEPIFAEICSTIEEVSSTLKEKCPYIEENETPVKKEIWCASKENYISDDKRVIEEKESTNTEICAKSTNSECAHSQSVPVKDAEQLSKKETVQDIPPTSGIIHQLNSKENTADSFIESLPLREFPTMHNDNLCSIVENSCEKNYATPISKLDCNNKEESSSSTVEEMLSLFKEICSSVENKVLPEEMHIEENKREDSSEKCSENKNRIVPLAIESSLEKSSENKNRIVPLTSSSSSSKESIKNEDKIAPLAPLSSEKSSKNENKIVPIAASSSEKSSKNENKIAPLAASSSEKSSKNENKIAPLAASSSEKSSKNEDKIAPLAAASSEKSSKNEDKIAPLSSSSSEKSSKNEDKIAPLAAASSEKSSKNEDKIAPLAAASEKSSKNENKIAPLASSSSEESSKNEDKIVPLASSSSEKSSKNENKTAPLASSSSEKSSKSQDKIAPLASSSSSEKSSKNQDKIAPLAATSSEKSRENENTIVPLAESSLEKCSENKCRITPLAIESSSPMIEEIKSISSFSPCFEENSESLEYFKPTLEEDISTTDEAFQLAPESPVEEISKTIEVDKLEANALKTEESTIKIGENQSIKSTDTDKTIGVLPDWQNIKESRGTSVDEFSGGSDNSKDKSLYEGSHICDLDHVISQFRHKHSQESKNSNSQITRTTKFQDNLPTKNKNRPVNIKKLKKVPNSSYNENSNVPLIWSNQTTNSEEKEKEDDVELVEKTEVVVNTNDNILQQPSTKKSVETESKKDQENVNRKQLVTTKLEEEENKENHAFCQWSKEKDELSFQIKNLSQTQKITRFIVKELVNLISRWMEDSRKENSELKESKLKLIAERDQAIEDLRSVENAFSDLHRRYEKSKTIVEEYRENENRLKQQMAESALKLKQQKEMYKLLKKRSEERLEEANAEIVNVQKSQETEIAVLKAQLRKAEMKANSLEKSLEQKIRENTELSSICEDLIAKVGRN